MQLEKYFRLLFGSPAMLRIKLSLFWNEFKTRHVLPVNTEFGEQEVPHEQYLKSKEMSETQEMS